MISIIIITLLAILVFVLIFSIKKATENQKELLDELFPVNTLNCDDDSKILESDMGKVINLNKNRKDK